MPDEKKRLSTLYTYAEILTNVKDGDSLSDIFEKTSLSYVTVSKSVKELEKIGFIRTEEKLSNHGKAIKCFILKPSAKEKSYSFIEGINNYKDFLDGKPV